MARSPGELELLEAYRAALIEMHAERIEAGGDPRKWNPLVDRLQLLQLQLRESAVGRAGITDLALNDKCPTVKAWAAAHALFWDEKRVRPVLEAQMAEGGLVGFEAEMGLREHDAGRLRMDWTPGKRKGFGRRSTSSR